MKLFQIAILVLISACSHKDNVPDCKPEMWSYTFETGKTLVLDTFQVPSADTVYERYVYQVKDGSNLVFYYSHAFPECEHIIDDEVLDRIVFEIPAGATTIVWNDSTAFQQGKLYYHRIGAWGLPPMPIKAGTLEAQKRDGNRWHVKAALLAPEINGTFNFEQDFTP